jgi:hypothetical protein
MQNFAKLLRSKIEARDPAFLKYETGNLLIELIFFIYFENVFSSNTNSNVSRCRRWDHSTFIELHFISSISILRCLCFSFSNIVGFKTSCGQSSNTDRTEANCWTHERWYILLIFDSHLTPSTRHMQTYADLCSGFFPILCYVFVTSKSLSQVFVLSSSCGIWKTCTLYTSQSGNTRLISKSYIVHMCQLKLDRLWAQR